RSPAACSATRRSRRSSRSSTLSRRLARSKGEAPSRAHWPSLDFTRRRPANAPAAGHGPAPRGLVALGLEKLFRFHSRHAACAGGGDGLLIDAVLDVAGVEHTRQARARR